MGSKINLLVVAPSTTIGGVQSIIKSIIENLPRGEYEWHIAAPRDGVMFEEFEGLGANMHEIPKPKQVRVNGGPVLYLRNLLRNRRFDLIHAHNARAGLWVALATVGKRSPFIYTGHDWRFAQYRGAFGRCALYLGERFICRLARRVTFVTPSHEGRVATEYRLVPLAKTRVIPNRVDIGNSVTKAEERDWTRLRVGLPLDRFVIGTVGRLSYQKGPDIFLNIARRLADLEAHFLWVGDGELRQEALQFAESLGLSKRFVITGDRPIGEVPALLRAMDVFLLTSRYEGLPLALLEAMAARTPVVASAVGGVLDVVIPGSTGWLFEPGDGKEAAQHVEAVLGDLEGSKALSHRAYDRIATEFSPRLVMAQQYHRLYQEVLS